METTEIESQGRGQLTDRIKRKSSELLGYEISRTELRLIPYLQYQLANAQRISLSDVNQDEREILANWVSIGYILDGVTENGRPMMSDGAKLKISKDFWNIISEIVWLGYVDLNS